MEKKDMAMNASITDDIAAIRRHTDDEELRQSLLMHGWHEQFPALQDENGVTLVGNRRMKLAKELGITPQIVVLKLGKGEAADAERLKLALISNIGGAPMSAEDKKNVAIHLYQQRGWKQQRIAEALVVTQKTVSKYLDGIYTRGINVEEDRGLDTLGRKKSPGRTKGSGAKPRAETAPKAVEREERVAKLMDLGLDTHAIADEIGLGLRATNQAMEHVKIQREVVPNIDPATLSVTAQQKLDLAIRQATKKLDLEYEERLRLATIERAAKRFEEYLLPKHQKLISEAERLMKSRKGVMARAQYQTIRRCLHPDVLPAIRSGEHIDSKIEARFNEAFRIFNELEIVLLSEQEHPQVPADLPRTRADWEALREKVRAERSATAKRGAATRRAKGATKNAMKQ